MMNNEKKNNVTYFRTCLLQVLEKKEESKMSNLGNEYVTEFGEFISFKTDAKDLPDQNEPFQDFIPLSEIDVTSSPTYAKIQEIVQRAKEEK